MTAAGDDLTRDYRAALLRHLGRHDETSREAGYELGRTCLITGVSVLEVVTVHHTVLVEVCAEQKDLAAVVGCAADFLVEVLSPYDLARRAATERPAPS